MATEWGRLGGRPRKLTLGEIMGEKGKNNEGGIADPPEWCLSPPPSFTATKPE